MKYAVYAALIASASAADELLAGTVACEASKQTAVVYDDAECATQSADQAAATSSVSAIDAGTN